MWPCSILPVEPEKLILGWCSQALETKHSSKWKSRGGSITGLRSGE